MASCPFLVILEATTKKCHGMLRVSVNMGNFGACNEFEIECVVKI